MDRDELIEAACQARCMVPNIHWADGMTEGVQAIERMLAEKQIDAILSRLQPSGDGEKASELIGFSASTTYPERSVVILPSYADGYAKAIEDSAVKAESMATVTSNHAAYTIAAAIRALAGKDEA